MVYDVMGILHKSLACFKSEMNQNILGYLATPYQLYRLYVPSDNCE
jgi:hypothetical protein